MFLSFRAFPSQTDETEKEKRLKVFHSKMGKLMCGEKKKELAAVGFSTKSEKRRKAVHDREKKVETCTQNITGGDGSRVMTCDIDGWSGERSITLQGSVLAMFTMLCFVRQRDWLCSSAICLNTGSVLSASRSFSKANMHQLCEGETPTKAPRKFSEPSLRQLTSILVSKQSLVETILPKCIR